MTMCAMPRTRRGRGTPRCRTSATRRGTRRPPRRPAPGPTCRSGGGGRTASPSRSSRPPRGRTAARASSTRARAACRPRPPTSTCQVTHPGLCYDLITYAAMLPGVSISRGHSPPGLTSPSLGCAEGRQGRSPSLTMPPASPVARNSRVRSASLAVSSSGGHKTPPHSPGAGNLLRATQRQHQHFTLSTASRPLVFTAHFLRGSNRTIFTLVHFPLLYITVCSTTTNNLN